MADSGNFLTQDELDALLGAISGGGENSRPEPAKPVGGSSKLTAEELDMIGEVGNIIMGSAATALFTIIGKEVQITTPDVRTSRLSEVRKSFKEERLVTILEFHQGLSGSNILVMDKKTALIIADLMMGGTGQDVKGELDELKSSAVGEAMNQMMGTASTAMAGFLKKPIAITPPNVGISDFSRKEVQFPEISTDGDTDAAVVSFRMEIEDLATTELYQIVPISFVKRLYALFTEGQTPAPPPAPPPKPAPVEPPVQAAPRKEAPQDMGYFPPPPQKHEPVTVQKAEFEDFSSESLVHLPKQLELLYDVPLEITVELGRSRLTLKEILDLSIGSIIELDKLTGEHVDILVNGKVIARGEVVVVEESFGVRVTEIVNPRDRLRTLR
ncbi:MAG TPA: flagellar motor switch phosphatase FliY [Thermotogota bacterium]|nr:MAG: Flagellar motor switch protein FliN [Thermotogota bacterium ADurb.Bin062]HNW47139.1 flagellar motor switch phosphatase FliY [Thermotogota bacterium]HOD91835.1 flagellar motor switch phosphatase FliY [Thermotogota bacterium]HOF24302.1 flagellar motor switch phosphatase FliY [Thermotogota bacterium]HOH12574.1 flagellar motor switch phosphatase FliY [Thermotogota bacterium]